MLFSIVCMIEYRGLWRGVHNWFISLLRLLSIVFYRKYLTSFVFYILLLHSVIHTQFIYYSSHKLLIGIKIAVPNCYPEINEKIKYIWSKLKLLAQNKKYHEVIINTKKKINNPLKDAVVDVQWFISWQSIFP